MGPTITDIETIKFRYDVPNVGGVEGEPAYVYNPGHTLELVHFAVRVHTDADITGEFVSWTQGGSGDAFGATGPPSISQIEMVKDYYLGKDALKRERHWSEIKLKLRKYDRMGLGPVDIALWDIAGKYHDAPIHELLGTYRERLPTYASTYYGDNNGGLDSPTAFADFAEECLDLGYPAYKIHAWGGSDRNRNVDRLVDTIHAVGERVGDEMDLMLDPACEYETWGDALKIGRACDEEGFFWYEDPYRDGGFSQHSHRKLSQKLDTPILQGEHIRSLENRTDFMTAEATDFIRTDPEYDGGITGAIKTARAAEGLGLDVEIHAPGPAHRHCMAAMRNSNYYENAVVHPEAPHLAPLEIYENYTEELETVADDGTFPVPDGPGLGIEYDWSYIEDHQVEG